MFLNVVCAKSFVLLEQSSTFVTEVTAFDIRKYTTTSTATVTESLESISCAGMSNDTTLKSTFRKESVHGLTKNRPGPLAPPANNLPRRKTTARSYSENLYLIKF